jgi:multidrug resistance efflux pump
MENKEQDLKLEHEILDEEKKIAKDLRNLGITIIIGALIIGGGLAGGLYLLTASKQVNLDKAQITAPVIDLAPQTAGTLEEVYVNVGDAVRKDTAVARVGNEIVKPDVDGTILSVNKDIGKLFGPGVPVATIIDPNELRVVAQADEDKGLKDISVGQGAIFTVDAFGSKKFSGTVDEVSPTSRASGVVFSISDKRATQTFDVKIRFNVTDYPELKNGMSAKVIIYKN